MTTKTAGKILVMDDEEMVRIIVQAQLKAIGYDAIMVADGDEAIRTYTEMQEQGTPFDLVIMDLTIPGGMGGQETARKLKQLDPQAKLILSSGYSDDPVLTHYRDYGFSAVIAKPISIKELIDGIHSALQSDRE